MNEKEIMNRPIKENGNIHVARKNNYSHVIDKVRAELEVDKRCLKIEAYIERLENKVMYLEYANAWEKARNSGLQERLVKAWNENK